MRAVINDPTGIERLIMPELNADLVALHRHWLLADAVRYHGQRPSTSSEVLPPELDTLALLASSFGVMQIWYGLLYVVIEGYQERKLSDAVVDALLADKDHVDALRRLRNATFHFQQDPFTPKLWDYLIAPGSEVWIRDVNAAFRSFFERDLGIAAFYEALKSAGNEDPSESGATGSA